MATQIVVIGGGTAGTRLARRLAASDAAPGPGTGPGTGTGTGVTVTVTVIGEEPHTPYNRVLLAEVLAGRYGPDVIALPTT
ncbi:hypothetical protein HRW15_29310, partial [Streptomyces lunaelactis]|nr:hypothetical protein [Streptomyces lunaelactis]